MVCSCWPSDSSRRRTSMSKYIPGNQKHLTLEDRKYKECLSQSRAGINMTRHELHQEDMVITPLIFQGQSPYQIMTNHPELDISVRTLYSYLDKGILSARNIDLKRQVKFNPKRKPWWSNTVWCSTCCPWFHTMPLQSSQSMSHPPAATLHLRLQISAFLYPVKIATCHSKR